MLRYVSDVLTLSRHAEDRVQEKRIPRGLVFRVAFDGRCLKSCEDGRIIILHGWGLTVIIDTWDGYIITAYRGYPLWMTRGGRRKAG